ncbi:hypothetical protein BT93_L0340 [Corymbia citriodora subsp. variegata]|uniref:TIR domain-containing protein n=1 Tax=Corymbia citriodora subsp. variegata TaxID=360336 RepID=A0A8T0CUR5_CORYI|nr:hypothetical protein BT93_L0340 [Corymbia citriodora subsp. variegata]
MSSSSSSSEAKWLFDVFLSFRGQDVRHGFLADLHRCLLHGGINAYIDSEDLRPGDQISPALKKAIKESRIAVLVFSENYASSRWCLDELVKVMECKRLKGQLVLPVFYRVGPMAIRWQTESYGKALARHEERLGKDSERVKKWREALFEAANLSGWHYDNGDDTKFIESIVKEISTIVGRVPLKVAKFPIGVDCRVENVKSLLSMDSDDVRMIGIWGTGGVGKTTISKAVYNSIADQFNGCSFLANVRETSSRPDGLVHLQKKLLSQILWKKTLAVLNVDGGANLIRDRLRYRKILLVLDDVDHRDQLNALAGELEWFGKGSRIIITTRDKHVLTSHGIDHVYEVKPLDQGEAFELLSSYAFPGNQMKDISKDLIHNILGYANGLPLAIVVLGPFLCGRSGREWESTLENLAKSPNKDINSVFKISFDALEDNEKDIFLDIACFFKGGYRDYVTRVLDGCGLKTSIGIPILIERSLVTIEDKSTVQMHDLIQLMGQDVVKKECMKDPGKRSRLWCYDDVFEVLSEATGTDDVKGIVLRLSKQEELDISPNAFTRMRRLKLLIISNAQISGGPVYLPNDLRWLEWPGCPLSTPVCVPKKLVCFDVHNSCIVEFGGNLKDFRKMKFINFRDCQSMICMPDLNCTPNLEELNLSGCKNLKLAHESIANHNKLQFLDLSGCSKLHHLTDVLQSKNLRHLNLNHCSKLRRFPDIPEKIEGIKTLNLESTSIEELPASIENLVSLERMDLMWCQKLAILPPSIYWLPNLAILNLRSCSKLIKFPKMEEDSSGPLLKTGFPKLNFLDLSGCNLSEVEFLENQLCFPFLSALWLSRNNFTYLPTCGQLNNLVSLDVSYCQQLQEIVKIPGQLRDLRANSCESLSKIPFDICREMPKWLLPNKEGSISFMASKELYEKFLGLAFCVAFRVEEGKKDVEFQLLANVNGKPMGEKSRTFTSMDFNHVYIECRKPKQVWEVDAFGLNDWGHFQFSIISSGERFDGEIVKKFGFRLICKPLEKDLEVFLQDDQLLDPALLYEVCD